MAEAGLDTLPKCFLAKVQQYPDDQVAMRQKDFGIWRDITWRESHEHVKQFALGMVSLGLQRGDKVCIIGDNDPQYFWAQLAVQAAGGIAVGIFTDSVPREIQYVVEHADATFVLAKDQEQCDKLLEIRHQVPEVRRVIYWDEKGLWSYDEPWLISFEEVEALGQSQDQKQPRLFEELVAEGRGDDLAVFCYTSGTTGLPKGVMIDHSNLISGCDLTMNVDPRMDTDDYVSFLPPAWITENVLGLTVHLRTGMIVNFPEAPETVQENIREVAPQALLFSARLWENMVAMVQMRMTDSSAINRLLYRFFMPVGYKVARMRFEERRPVSLPWRFLYALGDWAVYQPLRDKLGLIKVKSAYSSGAAVSPDVIRFFRAVGVNIKQLFGSTEAQVHTLHIGDDVRFETVGVPLPGMDVEIADDGEILVRGPTLFRGYYKDPEATAAKLKDGWFHTGDAGHFGEDGHLIYLDRVKDLIQLAGGERFSPQYIEGQLKFSPYVRDAMAVGGTDKPYVTGIINIDFDNVGRWAERRGLAYTTFVDLSQKPEVYDLISADVERVNRTLPSPARMRKFVLLHKEFDPDEAELTRTRKLRRTYMEERYKLMIDTMYSGGEEVRVQAEVRYRDGRTGVVDTSVRVRSLD
ncbi:MAG: AMP-binding protein [Anaerolineae bacterium]|nr:AMP-binding protein [Anaerolineae bacterium]NIN96919.1 AMP-binding protein [Anaerolineae bacterium]NIQ79884.1 AMP-binding protein [Anaerolineae bacterium]